MKEIKLSKGKVALVDDEDFENLNQFKWIAWKRKLNFYARRTKNTKGEMFFMHHFVLGKPPKGMVTDHKDRNGLNNQRSNIRHCTQSENMMNTRRRSKFAPTQERIISGVWYNHRAKKKWSANVKKNGARKSLGSFYTEQEAANAIIKFNGTSPNEV